jgi:hypothetical protein
MTSPTSIKLERRCLLLSSSGHKGKDPDKCPIYFMLKVPSGLIEDSWLSFHNCGVQISQQLRTPICLVYMAFGTLKDTFLRQLLLVLECVYTFEPGDSSLVLQAYHPYQRLTCELTICTCN